MTAEPVLFPEPAVARSSALGRVEPAVHWFTESTRPEAATSRETVNRWYGEFDDTDGRLAKRLRSELDVDHYQALDELHVHHLLRTRHDDVRYEEGGVGPDFRVYDAGACVGSVEVLSLFERADWDREQLQHARLADELDRRIRPTAGYFVDFQIERCERDPAPRRFAEFIARRIDELPDPQQVELPAAPGPHDLPSAVYEQDGCVISIRFIPMRAGAAARSDRDARIVGMGPMIGGMVNSGARLKDRLVAKAGGRYELHGAPSMIAACVHDFLCSDDQVLDALYGGEAVVVDTGQLVRRRDGLFGVDATRGAGRNTRVSAVGVISRFSPWAPAETDVAVLENPYAATPWPSGLLPWRRWFDPVEKDEQTSRFGWSAAPGEIAAS